MHTDLFIAGAYCEATRGQRFPDIEPATESQLALVASATEEDVQRAVEAARKAADKGKWPRRSVAERARVLNRMADIIERRASELGKLEARDVGKPVRESITHDIMRSARNLRFFAAAAETWTQEACASEAKFLGHDLQLINLTLRPPVGVGAIIIPWNSPLMLATWNLGPCLVTGNTCVLKPSELAPLSCIALGEIASEAGLPPGVLNILPGLAEAGAALVSNPSVDAVAFTGGVATGRKVMEAASTTLKRITLELGGKSPNLVFADAELKSAAAGVARSIFRSQGQSCVAGSRLLIDRRVADDFLPLLLNEVGKLKIGDPLDERTDFGPLISASHRQRVDGFVQQARREGAEVLIGGGPPKEFRKGYYYLPTILDDVRDNSAVVREEIFGPVLTVERFEDEAHAVELANTGHYGLAAYIWTTRMDRALRVASKLKTGMVWVNSFFLRDLRTPFGGARASGLGRQGGRYSLEFWTEPRLVCMTYEDVSCE